VVARLVGFLVISLGSICVVGTLNFLRIDCIPMCSWYFGTIARILGFRTVVRGQPSAIHPTLIVANHVSYFDIFVLGGLIKGAFIAKEEVSAWPLVGFMSRIGKTVYVDRRRSATGAARTEIQERLDSGGTLIMFPESTSHDGNRVRPFKSALFTVAEKPTAGGRPVMVQPVSIAYTRLNGVPMGIGWRSFFAWYGDMDLMPHLWYALKLGKVTAEVTFHTPVTISDFPDRKSLAAYCTRVSSDGMARLLSGREAA